MAHNIGFISTRFAGQDGVSLESAKWAEVLWDDRHVSYWYSGQSDRSPDISHVVPEAYFVILFQYLQIYLYELILLFHT